MIKIIQGFVVAILLVFGKINATPWIEPKQLQPVHGLYVQPSADGSTGDLYVAATEDSGSKTKWLTDQTINFLPVGAATQQRPTTVPLPYTSSFSASGHDEASSTQKRAVISSPPVQYAYALPVAGATEGALQYSYAIPAVPASHPTSSSESSSTPQCAEGTIPYNPFQFFYPHVMSAYSNAKSILKESGMSDDSAGAIVSQAAPMWSPYGAYPMYVMVDPSTWAQAQVTQKSTSTTTTTPKET